MAALRYILLAAAITLTLALLAHLVLPARGPIPRRTGRRGGLGIAAGSSNRGGIGAQFFYANTPIVLTSAGGNFTGGAVALSIHCVTVDPPV